MKWVLVVPALVIAWYGYWLTRLHRNLSSYNPEWLNKDWEGWGTYIHR